MFEVGHTFDLPVVGPSKAYMTGHDEVHSLSKNYPNADVRFWMGFGDHYINVFTVLNNLGLLSEQPVKTAEGLEVVPLKVVKAVLPDPSSLAPDYTGKTCIGDFVKGTGTAKRRKSSSITLPTTKTPITKWVRRAFPTPLAFRRLQLQS